MGFRKFSERKTLEEVLQEEMLETGFKPKLLDLPSSTFAEKVGKSKSQKQVRKVKKK